MSTLRQPPGTNFGMVWESSLLTDFGNLSQTHPLVVNSSNFTWECNLVANNLHNLFNNICT